MTPIEKRIGEQMHKNHTVCSLIEKNVKKLEEHIASRIEDRYFADSWEQSSQISKNIKKLEGKVNFLKKCQKKLRAKNKLSANELTSIKLIAIKPARYW